MNYRLYSFVANHYLSPLQCGLQTAHVVSELSLQYECDGQDKTYIDWAANSKTIIICAASNHAGVVSTFETLKGMVATAKLPFAIFYEDEQSMNGMATACGIIVPEKIYDVKDLSIENTYPDDPPRFIHETESGFTSLTPEEIELHLFLKSFRLA